ncbi:glycosyltransferase family 2 protein [Planctomonas sp. JC2975]|uniref:glycosyltransferase family 2 protein n=1 Tax=Planctomonas sp. JC2975 TaxID=2729626 RepID=UPI0014740AEC|nr:glycosyltransferase family A protein [Planctomonas sp. JC2975]NNC11882.1 glycosyltransferase family 2 protein [Planctomonas sp. JC2975]
MALPLDNPIMGGTDNPIVSIVLATNRGGDAPFLRAAIESVLAQTYSNFELMIVDNGSAPLESIRALESLDPRIRSMYRAEVGVARARNEGAGATSGWFLVFIDDDDVWHPERLAEHVALMSRDPGIAVSYCRFRTIDEHGVELAPADRRTAVDIHDVFRGVTTGIFMPNIMIRRQAFVEVGGFNQSFRLAQDLDLLLGLARLGSVRLVGEKVLVDYRAHPGNVTKRYRELAGAIRVIVRLHRWSARQRGDVDLAADLTHRLSLNNRFAAWSAARAARAHFHARHPLAAFGDLIWALCFAPTAPFTWLKKKLQSSNRSPY